MTPIEESIISDDYVAFVAMIDQISNSDILLLFQNKRMNMLSVIDPKIIDRSLVADEFIIIRTMIQMQYYELFYRCIPPIKIYLDSEGLHDMSVYDIYRYFQDPLNRVK